MLKIISSKFILLFVSSFLLADNFEAPDLSLVENGDIVFHQSKSSQSKAIALATHSPLTHMGIVFIKKNKKFVYEAVGPVKLTPLSKWYERGQGKKLLILRAKESEELFSGDNLEKVFTQGLKFNKLPYDIYFEWSDQKIYCSELVWKMFKKAFNVELAPLEKLSDFDLSSEVVQKLMKKRYGENIPYNEKVISPVAIAHSSELEIVFSNFPENEFSRESSE